MRKSVNISAVATAAVALVFVGCGDSKSTPSNNTTTAGASSTGGSGAVGGSGATGGDSSANGTSTGGKPANGGGTAIGCQVSAAPATAMIADFSAGTGATTGLPAVPNGGMYTYPSGAAAPTIAIADGALHVTINTPAASAIQYVGYGIFFNDCTNGSQYTGVKFDIGGTMTGCDLQFINNFRDDATPANDVKGSCTVSTNCYGPQTALNFTPTVSSSEHPFVTLTAGFPVATVDTTFLTGVGWGFVIPAADPANPGASCVADFTIDNVTFY